MTPKEKALELVAKYSRVLPMNQTTMLDHKNCALIAVNEIIDAIDWHEYETPNKELNYWLDVRKEIENFISN